MAITQADLDADKAAVEAANQKLTQDQAAFDAVQPHLSVLDEIHNYVNQLPGEVQAQFSELIAKARALF
jgi:hypothetical protein